MRCQLQPALSSRVALSLSAQFQPLSPAAAGAVGPAHHPRPPGQLLVCGGREEESESGGRGATGGPSWHCPSLANLSDTLVNSDL